MEIDVLLFQAWRSKIETGRLDNMKILSLGLFKIHTWVKIRLEAVFPLGGFTFAFGMIQLEAAFPLGGFTILSIWLPHRIQLNPESDKEREDFSFGRIHNLIRQLRVEKWKNREKTQLEVNFSRNLLTRFDWHKDAVDGVNSKIPRAETKKKNIKFVIVCKIYNLNSDANIL